MLRTASIPLLLLVLVPLGCDNDPGDDTNNADEVDTGEDDEGPATPEELEQLCQQQLTRAACEAVPGKDFGEADSAWCAWMVEVPVQLEGETCGFGEPTGTCVMSLASDIGCDSVETVCGFSSLGWTRMEGDALVLAHANVCSSEGDPCQLSTEGEVIQGAPECACLCDPALPD